MRTISRRIGWMAFTFALLALPVGSDIIRSQAAFASAPVDEIEQESPPLSPETPDDDSKRGDKPPFTGGQPVDEVIFAAPGTPIRVTAETSAPNAGPVIEVWYGDQQAFGQVGQPSEWVSIFGTVSPIGNLDKLDYSLNGSGFKPLDIGPTGRRLFFDGDFNVEVPFDDLNSGSNTVIIRAKDTQNQTTTREVTVDYTPNQSWPLPYVADWGQTSKLEDVAQATDGIWAIEGDTVRAQRLAYDRLLAIGETDWSEYEVTVPVTIHGIDPDGFSGPSVSPGIGIITRWQGHYLWDTDAQLANGWERFGTLDWFRWTKDGGVTKSGLQRVGAKGGVVTDVTPQFETEYILKAQVEDDSSCDNNLESTGYFRFKVWKASQNEPSSWNIEGCDKDLNSEPSPATGSFLLVAHHVDASFGRVTVTPPDYRADLTVTANGNGSTSVSPQQSDYAYYDDVSVSATADASHIFTGWTGDIKSSENPLTFNITENTNLTANFVFAEYTIDVNSVGNGSVTKTPQKPVYGYQEEVLLTAVPDPGWRLDTWSGTVNSTAPTVTLTMTQPHSITATFVQDFYEVTAKSELPDGGTGALGVVNISVPVNPAGYLIGETVTATAVSATGWSFVGWRDALTGAENPTTLTVTGDTTVTGVFQLNQYTLSTDTDGLGTVALDSDGPYIHGTEVQAEASPQEGWNFKEWTGDVPVDQRQQAVATITMNANKAITALFELDVQQVFLPVVSSE